jgi:hypothetical protein
VGVWRSQFGQRVSHDAFDVRFSSISSLARIGQRTTDLDFSKAQATQGCEGLGPYLRHTRL